MLRRAQSVHGGINRDGQTQTIIDTCYLKIGPVIGINFEFILEADDEISL